MCTVTWARTADGYLLFSNRDERDSRRPALGPRVHDVRGVQYLAPVDGDHGGSWIGVNEFGVSLCLLNRYGDKTVGTNKAFVSRGLLLVDLMDCRSSKPIEDQIRQFDLTRFRPFSLLLLDVLSPATIFEWNGVQLEIEANAESRVPLSSSSAVEPGIAAERSSQFLTITQDITVDHSVLDRFHRSHQPERGPYSVCMHREWARTVSLSKVSVMKDEVRFCYEPGSPCESKKFEEVKLVRSSNMF